MDHHIERFSNALPAAISIHGVIAAADRGDFAAVVLAHLLLELLEISSTAGGERIAAVHESMNEDAINTLLLGHFQERIKMIDVRVNAAVGDEPEDVQAAATRTCVLHSGEQDRVLEELAVLDHQIDAGDVHVHDASGAYVEMADFAVAHLPIRQADVLAAGMNQGIRIFAEQAVVIGFAGQRDGISFGFGTVSPAIEDDEDERFWAHSAPKILAAVTKRSVVNFQPAEKLLGHGFARMNTDHSKYF